MDTSEIDAASNKGSVSANEQLPTILSGKYFKISMCRKKSVIGLCQICLPRNKEIKGMLTSSSNFRSHLKRKHPAEFQEYNADLQRRRRSVNVEDTTRVREEEETERDQFELDVTKYVISAMIPLKSVEDVYFRRMFKNLGFAEKVTNICRRTVGRVMNTMFLYNMYKIKEDLKTVSYVCTTADTWSTRRRSFFSVTVHWISSKYERKSAALACRRFAGVHALNKVTDMLRTIHGEFGLTNDKIVATITDNASNFAKTFKLFGINESSIRIEDEEDIPSSVSAEEEEEEVEPEEQEENANRTFTDYTMPRHIRCAAHTLNLCVTMDMMQTIRGNDLLSTIHTEVIQKCNTLWKAVMRPKSAEEIERIIGHTLRRPVKTRWNSLYDSLKQILENEDKITEIGRVLEIKNVLKENDFLYIKEHLKCTSPIAEAIDILQGENNIFYGILLPCLLSLQWKLKNLKEHTWTFCGPLSACLLASLETRFKNYFNFTTPEAGNVALAALSHPQFKNRWFLCIEEFHRDRLMDLFKETITQELKNNSSVTAMPTTSSTHEDFFYFGENSTDQVMDYASKASLQIKHFLEEKDKDWKILEKYPEIKKIFFKYNTPLPSSASVERLLSYTTITNSPKCNRLSDSNFEKRVILKANLNHFEK